MKIALLFGEVGFVSHQKMVSGILHEAEKDGTDVYMFTCEGWKYKGYSEYEQGEYNIFSLPDLTRYDGTIIDVDTIHNETADEVIKEKVRAAEKPCVSLNVDVAGAVTLRLENNTGIAAMVEHVAKEHGAKNIHYISGPMHNRDARERKAAFISTMEQLGLYCGEENITYGDFEYRSGQQAVEDYLSANRPLPEAFIVANDHMAVGAIHALTDAGYRVPEDVIVTGYDNSRMAEYAAPSLTTVDRREYEAGVTAYRMLKQQMDGKIVVSTQTIEGYPVFAASCGCTGEKGINSREKIRKLVDTQIYTENNLELLKRTEVEFFNLNSFEDFVKSIRKYVEKVEMDYFYLCFCGNGSLYREDMKYFVEGKKPPRDITVYSDTMWVPIAYEKGQWTGYDVFPTACLLPPESPIHKECSYYIVMPIHQGGYCMGYCVVGNSRDVPEGRFIQHLVLSIDNAMGSIWKHDTMQGMYDRINHKWLYDELTGIYNRSGLYKFAEIMMGEAAESQGMVSAIFIDLDGLKGINDEYGHEAGDLYIKTMADVLKKCRRKGELLVRYGGDEYVILSNQFDEQEVQEYIATIRSTIEKDNEQLKYRLSASIGYFIEENPKDGNLQEIIEAADWHMYQEKKEKKQKHKAARN
jgi:diguanylate cyclase (GGDEF)-like protein